MIKKLPQTALFMATLLLCFSCGVQQTEQETESVDTMLAASPSIPDTDISASSKPGSPTAMEKAVHENKRFRDVKVQQLTNDSFLITGQGQIFEASFNWIIEDGHNELQQGYVMTDAGAPEWGNFSFKVHAPKKDANSTLHLVIFETSAKDGSRQYELPLL